MNVRHCMCVSLTFMVASLVLSIYSVEIGDSQDKGDTNVLYNESISTPPSIYTCSADNPGPSFICGAPFVAHFTCDDMHVTTFWDCPDLKNASYTSSAICYDAVKRHCLVCCS